MFGLVFNTKKQSGVKVRFLFILRPFLASAIFFIGYFFLRPFFPLSFFHRHFFPRLFFPDTQFYILIIPKSYQRISEKKHSNKKTGNVTFFYPKLIWQFVRINMNFFTFFSNSWKPHLSKNVVRSLFAKNISKFRDF